MTQSEKNSFLNIFDKKRLIFFDFENLSAILNDSDFSIQDSDQCLDYLEELDKGINSINIEYTNKDQEDLITISEKNYRKYYFSSENLLQRLYSVIKKFRLGDINIEHNITLYLFPKILLILKWFNPKKYQIKVIALKNPFLTAPVRIEFHLSHPSDPFTFKLETDYLAGDISFSCLLRFEGN